MPARDHAIIIGVGPGLGAALVERCAREGLAVTAGARNAARLRGLLDQRGLKQATAITCDVTDAASVGDLFAQAIEADGAPSLVVFNASGFARGSILDLTASQVEAAWQVGCLGGFHVGQEAAKAMAPHGRGSILFTGATASLRGGAGFAPFAIAKFGLRALAQSLARELGPQGIHVAHILIDGQIGHPEAGAGDGDTKLQPAAIADAYWHLHRQPRSAWTQELDLRPWAEKF